MVAQVELQISFNIQITNSNYFSALRQIGYVKDYFSHFVTILDCSEPVIIGLFYLRNQLCCFHLMFAILEKLYFCQLFFLLLILIIQIQSHFCQQWFNKYSTRCNRQILIDSLKSTLCFHYLWCPHLAFCQVKSFFFSSF